MKVTKIKVKITKSEGWYKKGDTHTVLNEINFNFGGCGKPHFAKEEHGYGISINHCDVIGPAPIEYTIDQLREMVGHDFIVVD